MFVKCLSNIWCLICQIKYINSDSNQSQIILIFDLMCKCRALVFTIFTKLWSAPVISNALLMIVQKFEFLNFFRRYYFMEKNISSAFPTRNGSHCPPRVRHCCGSRMVLCRAALVKAIPERLSWTFTGRASRVVLPSILVMAISHWESPKN